MGYIWGAPLIIVRIRLLPIHYYRPTCAKQLSRTVAGGELSAQAGRENASTRGLFFLLVGLWVGRRSPYVNPHLHPFQQLNETPTTKSSGYLYPGSGHNRQLTCIIKSDTFIHFPLCIKSLPDTGVSEDPNISKISLLFLKNQLIPAKFFRVWRLLSTDNKNPGYRRHKGETWSAEKRSQIGQLQSLWAEKRVKELSQHPEAGILQRYAGSAHIALAWGRSGENLSGMSCRPRLK